MMREPFRERRNRALRIFAGTSILSRAVGVACQLAQVPLLLQGLGAEGFGLWATLAGGSYLLTVGDLGLGQSTQNKVATDLAQGNARSAQDALGTAFVALSAVGLILFCAGGALACCVNLGAVLNAPENIENREVAAGAVAMIAAVCLRIPLGLSGRLVHACQSGWKDNIGKAVGTMISLACVWAASRIDATLPVFVLATTVPGAIAAAALLILQTRALGWPVRGLVRFHLPSWRGLWRLGAHFGVGQICSVILFASPPIIISCLVGPLATAQFNIAQRLFNLFGIVQNAFMLPLIPAYTEAISRGEVSWVKRTFRRSLLWTLGASVLPMAGATIFSTAIIGVWTGSADATPSDTAMWLMFAWNASVFLGQPFGYLVAGLSAVRMTMAANILGVLGAVGLAFALGHAHGLEGIVCGLLVGFTGITVTGRAWVCIKVMRGMDGKLVASAAESEERGHVSTHPMAHAALEQPREGTVGAFRS